MIAKVLVFLLKKLSFSEKERLILTNALINSVQAVPIHAIITVDENRQVLVQGKALSSEQLMFLRESAASTLKSYARNLIREQVRFAAIDQGFLKSDNLKTQLFYKAALWYAQEEDALLKSLSDDPI